MQRVRANFLTSGKVAGTNAGQDEGRRNTKTRGRNSHTTVARCLGPFGRSNGPPRRVLMVGLQLGPSLSLLSLTHTPRPTLARARSTLTLPSATLLILKANIHL